MIFSLLGWSESSTILQPSLLLVLTSSTKSWNFLSYLWAVDWISSLLVRLELPDCFLQLLCLFHLSRACTLITFLNCTLYSPHWPVAVDLFDSLRHSLHQIGQQFAIHCPGGRTKCNDCSPINFQENLTPPSLFQRIQICPDIMCLQLTFVNCFIRYMCNH